MNKIKEFISVGIFVVFCVLALIGAFTIGTKLIACSPSPTVFVSIDYFDKDGNMKHETGYVTEADYKNLKKEKTKIRFYAYDIIYTDDIKSYK